MICDPVLLYVEEGRIWLSHGNVDLLLWAKGVALGAGFDVAVREADVAPMQVQGPLARTVLAPLVGDALDDLRYYRLTRAEIAGVPCVVSRTGWSGGRATRCSRSAPSGPSRSGMPSPPPGSRSGCWSAARTCRARWSEASPTSRGSTTWA